MTATEFTPLLSLLGGALIGVSAVLLLAFQGRIAGISGIAVRIFPPWADDGTSGRLAFLGGVVLAPLLVTLASGAAPVQTIAAGMPVLLLAGLLVGFGSVLGSGCTSGHGVCGLARLSRRSLIAVPVFMAAAFLTVFLTRHLP